MTYVPGFVENSALYSELLRISQAFEEAKIHQQRRSVTLNAGASVVVATANDVDKNAVYLAICGTGSTGGDNFTAYILRNPGSVNMALVAFANSGTNIQFSLVSNELVLNNSAGSTLKIYYNLIRLL